MSRLVAIVLAFSFITLLGVEQTSAQTVPASTVTGRCEQWQHEPAVCASFLPNGGNVQVFVPDGVSQSELLNGNVWAAMGFGLANYSLVSIPQILSFVEAQVPDHCRQVYAAFYCWQLFRPCFRPNQSPRPTFGRLCSSGCFETWDHCFAVFPSDEGFDNEQGYFPRSEIDLCQFEAPPIIGSRPFGFETYQVDVSDTTFDFNVDGTVFPDESCVPLPWSPPTDGRTLHCNEPGLRHSTQRPDQCSFQCPFPLWDGRIQQAVFVIALVVGWLSLVLSLFLGVTLLLRPKARVYPANLMIFECFAAALMALGFVLPTFGGTRTRTWCGEKEVDSAVYLDVNTTYEPSTQSTAYEPQVPLCAISGAFMSLGFLLCTLYWVVIGIVTFRRLTLSRQTFTRSALTREKVVGHSLTWVVSIVCVLVVSTVRPVKQFPSALRFSMWTLNCFPSVAALNITLVCLYVPAGVALIVGVGLYSYHVFTIWQTSRATSSMRSKKAQAGRRKVYARIAGFETAFIVMYTIFLTLRIVFNVRDRTTSGSSTDSAYFRVMARCLLKGFDTQECVNTHSPALPGGAIITALVTPALGILIFVVFADAQLVAEWRVRLGLGAASGSDTSATTRSASTGKNARSDGKSEASGTSTKSSSRSVSQSSASSGASHQSSSLADSSDDQNDSSATSSAQSSSG